MVDKIDKIIDKIDKIVDMFDTVVDIIDTMIVKIDKMVDRIGRIVDNIYKMIDKNDKMIRNIDKTSPYIHSCFCSGIVLVPESNQFPITRIHEICQFFCVFKVIDVVVKIGCTRGTREFITFQPTENSEFAVFLMA